MKRLLVAALVIGLMVGCAGMTKQDEEFLIQFAVQRTLEQSSQPDVRADQILRAVAVVEGAIDPRASAMLVDQLLIMTDEWVNDQDWLTSDKTAVKYIIRRSVSSVVPEMEGLRIDDEVRVRLSGAMRQVRDAVEAVR